MRGLNELDELNELNELTEGPSISVTVLENGVLRQPQVIITVSRASGRC